jgi:hypothetical protein
VSSQPSASHMGQVILPFCSYEPYIWTAAQPPSSKGTASGLAYGPLTILGLGFSLIHPVGWWYSALGRDHWTLTMWKMLINSIGKIIFPLHNYEDMKTMVNKSKILHAQGCPQQWVSTGKVKRKPRVNCSVDLIWERWSGRILAPSAQGSGIENHG